MTRENMTRHVMLFRYNASTHQIPASATTAPRGMVPCGRCWCSYPLGQKCPKDCKAVPK